MKKLKKPKGREPSSKTATSVTVRFESREQYERMLSASRLANPPKSLNEFCVEAILAAAVGNDLSLDQIRQSLGKRFKIRAIAVSNDRDDELIGSVDTYEQAQSVVKRFYSSIKGCFLVWSDSDSETSA